MKQLKVLLLQPLATEFWLRSPVLSYNLAAGYLKAMAEKEGLLEKVEIDILDARMQRGLPGTAALVNSIVAKSYDLLGFSVYSFNSLQSLYIASEVKKRLPRIKILFGGPEIVTDAEYIMNDPVIDFGCFGEGELTFVELIKRLLSGTDDYENIKGIFYRKNEKAVITSPREPIGDLSQVPSPHLSGILPFEGEKAALIETTRGCSLKCAYCRANDRTSGVYPAERVIDEVACLLNRGVRNFFIIDSDLLDSPNFSQICKGISSRCKGDFSMFANICVEGLTPEKADMLKACNVNEIEIGLQSIHSFTRKKIHRPRFNKEKFVAGVQLLKERNIKCHAGIILGLPGESLEGFMEGLSFLDEVDINPLFHRLQIFPGSKLWNEREKYGIKNMPLPPYLITETKALSQEEIERAITLRYGEQRPFIIKGIFVQRFEPHKDVYRKKNVEVEEDAMPDSYVNKVTIDLVASHDIKHLKKNAAKISGRVGQIFTVWFRFASSDKNSHYKKTFDLIEAFIRPIVDVNPFIPIQIILESDKPAPLDFISKINGVIQSKTPFSSDTRRLIDKGCVFSLLPFETHNDAGDELPVSFYYLWTVTISNEENWEEKLNGVIEKKSGLGIILDFHHDTDFETIVKVMRFLPEHTEKTEFFFRNLAHESLFQLLNPLRRTNSYWSEIETIVSVDPNCMITPVLLPLPQVKLDLFSWQLKAQKVAHE